MPGVRSVAFVLLVFTFAGCKPQENRPAPIPSVNTHSASTGWGKPEAGNVPGVDYATVYWYTWNGKLALAIWVDRSEGGGSNGSSGSGEPGVYTAKFHASRSAFPEKGLAGFDVQCTTTDGVAGRIRIDGRELYDLADGTILLLSRSDGALRTRLLKRQRLPSPEAESEVFAKLKSDPEVVAFFAKK
jgi:hypothetical protein